MADAKNDPVWEERLAVAAAEHLQRYFGGWGGLTAAFPCMREQYPWADHRPDVLDSRIPAKNNTEYHDLEALAGQYHAAAMYEPASHHWLMAAWCRQIDMKTNGFDDDGHHQAVAFCLKNSMFNEALKRWSDDDGRGAVPEPEEFGLSRKRVDDIEARGAQVLEKAFKNMTERDAEA